MENVSSSTDPLLVRFGDGRGYPIHFRSLADTPTLMTQAGLSPGRCLLITDDNVAAHYRSPLRTALRNAGWSPHDIVVPAGESTKSAEHLQSIYDAAFSFGMDRDTPVLALGGGVVGDLAGFAAATLLRGVPLVHLPTSLIAQVDSSIGGKTGINHAAGKNLIGAFYQPTLVVSDVRTTDTLPQREWTSGMAEVIKHALIADEELVAFLEAHITDLLLRRTVAVAEMIRRAAQVKVKVVAADEREQGRRAILNFGHTFGHAIEREAGYGAFTHGEAVAVGMRAALRLSYRLHPSLDVKRADALVRTLPIEGDPQDLSFSSLHDAMRHDKKNKGDTIRFILLDRIGHAYLTDAPTTADLRHAWNFAKSVRT
jgi:3-dehydroquinate synthase